MCSRGAFLPDCDGQVYANKPLLVVCLASFTVFNTPWPLFEEADHLMLFEQQLAVKLWNS